MNNYFKKFFSPLLLLSLISLLPGCDWSNKECSHCEQHDEAVEVQSVEQKSNDPAVITMQGKTVMTLKEFDAFIEKIKEAQPNLQQVLQFLPESQRCQVIIDVAEDIANKKAIYAYAQEAGLTKKAEYQEMARILHEHVDLTVAERAVSDKEFNDITISDADAKAFYETNKARLRGEPFVTTLGGITIKAIEAANEAEAQKIKAALEAKGADINKVAETFKKKVEDFGLVNEQSVIDQKIKNEALMMATAGTVAVVKSAQKTWVIKGLDKVVTQYAPFENVADAIKSQIRCEKFPALFEAKQAEIKKKFAVAVNEDVIRSSCATLANKATSAVIDASSCQAFNPGVDK